MRFSRWTLGVAVAALALGTGCRSRSSNEYDKTSGATAAAEVQGVVSDKSHDQLKVSDASGQQHTVKTNHDTQFFIDGQKSSGGLDQVREGTPVRASFPEKGEKEPALRIDVLGAGSEGGSQGRMPDTSKGSQGSSGASGAGSHPSGGAKP